MDRSIVGQWTFADVERLHANGHELRTGAEHHEMVGDLLAATLAELRLGQIDDLQVTQVRQSVDLEVLQGIHRGIQLPELWQYPQIGQLLQLAACHVQILQWSPDRLLQRLEIQGCQLIAVYIEVSQPRQLEQLQRNRCQSIIRKIYFLGTSIGKLIKDAVAD